MRPAVFSLLLLIAACGPVAVQTTGADGGELGDGASDAASADHAPADASAAERDSNADGGAGSDASAGSDPGWPAGPELDRTINFQPVGNPPSGAEADHGELFSALRGYGWTHDLTGATERADLRADDLLDTYVAAGAAGRVDTWELMLPEARYLVTLASGDPIQATAPTRIVAEGVPLIAGANALRNEFLWVVDREIGVRDGKLSLQLGSGEDPSLLNYLRVRSAEPAGSCAARTEVCNQLDDDCDQNPDDGAVCSLVPYCYSSTLENASAVSSGGFSLRGGSFVDGGLQIDAPGTRVERSLGGNFYQGKVSFEARGLHWQKPLASGATGCLRMVFDLNHNESGVADHARLFLASMAPGCGGNDAGVLRASMHSAFCCLDSAPLPSSDDNLWHSYALRWTAATVSLEIDSTEVAQTGYRGPSVGQNPLFWFGSAGGSGDASGAVFRNLEVCNQP